MNDSRIKTIEQIEKIVNENNFGYKIESKQEAYQWIEDRLNQFRYFKLCRKDRGILRQYLQLITGYSYAQIGRDFHSIRKLDM